MAKRHCKSVLRMRRTIVLIKTCLPKPKVSSQLSRDPLLTVLITLVTLKVVLVRRYDVVSNSTTHTSAISSSMYEG